MKKTLIALAALAVVSAASAQSTVTMYGLLDLGVGSYTNENNGADTKTTSVQQGALSNSRLGFKGSEDLGGGLKANFVAEFSLYPDVSAQTFANRQSTIGLSGKFGEMTIGSTYTPYFVVQNAVDLVGNANATPGYVVNNHMTDGGRARNAITYTTPSFSGFTVTAQVSAGSENAENAGKGVAITIVPTVVPVTAGSATAGVQNKSFGLSGIYAAGPLVAALAYNSTTNPYVATGTDPHAASWDNISGLGVNIGTGATELNVWAAGALYDFGVAKASLAYTSLTAKQVAGDDITSKGYNVSVAVPFGAVTVVGNAGKANLQVPGLTESNITGFQLGANYALSKRTTAYALIGKDTTQSDVVTAGGEYTRRSTTVGLRHTF